MRYVVCNATKQFRHSNFTIQLHKGLVICNLIHVITSMKKHIDNQHGTIIIKYRFHCKQGEKSIHLECEKNKRHKGATPFAITNLFGSQQPYKSSNPTLLCFIEDLMLFIAK
jgi:hypothetical protein